MLIIFLLLTINPSSSSVLQRRFLSKDPSSSSSSVHFQVPKNLRSFKDFRQKIVKIWENLPIFTKGEIRLKVNIKMHGRFLILYFTSNLKTLNFPQNLNPNSKFFEALLTLNILDTNFRQGFQPFLNYWFVINFIVPHIM